MRKIVCCLLLFCTATVLFAQNDAPVTESDLPIAVVAVPENAAAVAPGMPESGVWIFIRMILVLAVVIAAIYGVIYFLKKISKTPDADSPYIRHISGITLAPGKTVHIVTVGSNGYLIGAADNAVSLISEITDRELVDSMNLNAGEQNPEHKNFADALAAMMPFLRKKAPAADDTAEPDTVLPHLTDRLSKTPADDGARPSENGR